MYVISPSSSVFCHKKGLKKDRGLLVFENWSSGGISLPKKLYGRAARPWSLAMA